VPGNYALAPFPPEFKVAPRPDDENAMATIPQKTLDELGFPALLKALAAEARTAVGKERALALELLQTRAEVSAHLSRVAEVRRLARQGLEVPVGGVPDAREHVARAAREGVLEPTALLSCAGLVRGAVRVRRFLQSRASLCPQLAAEAESLSDFEPLAAEIERAVEPGGTVSDHASPQLAELRERARGLHRTVKGRIDEMLRDIELDEILRDKYYTIRDERYVVPVKASHRSRLPGIVHNASQSGQTLFIEPDQLIDLGNQLTIVQAMALEEERRILRDLSEAIGRRSAELEGDIGRLGELDRLGACGRLSDRLDAVEPALLAPEQPFELLSLRHPLLVLRGVPVVANDVRLTQGRKGLIISGPNAGGKTVTLGAVGLCALMVRAGLPVPAAEGSKVPLYARVFTAIGDEGDLSKDLSTFTAHLTALRDIARETIPGTLVCIDEMAADTDPREGAAIASAMLEELAERGANVLITTHLDEVKAKGLTDDRFLAASVGFDLERLAPTYRLRMNVVGASSAIEIAARVGLSEKVCQRARELLGGSGGALGKAVAALDAERGELLRLESSLEEERARLAHAREEWERQLRQLQQRESELEHGLRREVVKEIEAARDEVRLTLARLQGEGSVRAAVETQKRLEAQARREAEAAARAKAKAEAIAAKEVATLRPDELKAGHRVKVAALGREGTILEMSGGEAVVSVGALTTRVPLSGLVPLVGKAKNEAKFSRSRGEKDEAMSQARAAPLRSGPGTIDLRGLRTEDALRHLREQLDQAIRGDSRELAVRHGHGTGALKKAVREELGSSPYVQNFRPAEAHEGGDGVTVLTLRES
jgi:DNA mismatch repair protein MutS2